VTGVTTPPEEPSPPPEAIAVALGSSVLLAQRYVDLLLTDGVQRGVIGPGERDRVWDRHLANSLSLAPLLPDHSRVVDVGSGAGLPGIPLALFRPDLEVELLEPMQRRVDFLVECLVTLGLDRVSVRRGRAPEDLTAERSTVVVARAVAKLPKLIAATRPVLAAGGVVLALKGQSAQAEMDTVRDEKLPVRLELLNPSFADLPATVVRVRGLPGSHGQQGSSRARRTR
jgi:16S rRNA (guanine527-N7)-methyltransferase